MEKSFDNAARNRRDMTLSLGKWWAVGNLSVKPSATKPTTNVSNKMRMKMESSRRSLILASAGCIMALAFTPAASAATILTFRDGTGAALPDDQSVPAAYGDNVTTSPEGGFSYGLAGSGYTPNITTAYGATARTYTGGYGDLSTVLWNESGPSLGVSPRILTFSVIAQGQSRCKASIWTKGLIDRVGRFLEQKGETAAPVRLAADRAKAVLGCKASAPLFGGLPCKPRPPVRFSWSYGYDTAGNRDSSLAFGQTASYVSNSVNEYTSITGGGFQPPRPAYDDNGNATTWNLKPLGSSNLVSSVLSWDIHNRARTFATLLGSVSWGQSSHFNIFRYRTGTVSL